MKMPHRNDDGVANSTCYSNSNRMEIVTSFAGKWIFQNLNYTRKLEKNPMFYVYTVINNRFHHHPDLYDGSDQGVWLAFLPHVLTTVIAIVVVSRILHCCLRYLKQPLIVSQLIAGILIFSFLKQKTLLLNLKYLRVEFVLGLTGALFNLFVVGVKFDFSRTLEFGRKTPLIIGLFSQLTTLIVGYAIFGFLHLETVSFGGDGVDFLFYLMHPLTSTYQFCVMNILEECHLLNSELGRLALSSTMMQFITQYVFFILLIVWKHRKDVSITIGISITVLFAIIILLIRPYTQWIVRSAPPNGHVRNIHMISIILIVLVIAIVSDIIGFLYLAGPFLMGLILPTGPPLGTDLIKQLNLVSTELLLPIVFMAEGYYVDWTELKMKHSRILGVLLLVVASSFTKIAASIGGAMYCKMTFRDGLILGVMMNFRGLIDVLYYISLRNQNIIDGATFTAMVLSTVVILAICVPLVVIYYKPLRTRKNIGCHTVQNVPFSSHEDELRVMVCFYDEKPIPALLDFVESLSPIETSNKSICIYPIHIVELQGRGESDLIWHSNIAGSINYSEQMECDIHNHFTTFEQSKRRGVNVIPFTSITPLKTMHRDVCSLILKRDISLVIVPFPKKNSLAALEDNDVMQELVPLVLEEASCSVGIMVHDGKTRQMISEYCEYHIVVLFFGGPDDREAIAIASNLAHHPSIYLNIICFDTASTDRIDQINHRQNGADDKEKLADDKVISELEAANSAHDHVSIKKITVGNMEQVFPIIQNLADKADLLIVGRKQEHLLMLDSDLEKWVESPALGVIGDILAADASCVANLLIVQQHQPN